MTDRPLFFRLGILTAWLSLFSAAQEFITAPEINQYKQHPLPETNHTMHCEYVPLRLLMLVMSLVLHRQ